MQEDLRPLGIGYLRIFLLFSLEVVPLQTHKYLVLHVCPRGRALTQTLFGPNGVHTHKFQEEVPLLERYYFFILLQIRKSNPDYMHNSWIWFAVRSLAWFSSAVLNLYTLYNYMKMSIVQAGYNVPSQTTIYSNIQLCVFLRQGWHIETMAH